jgi:glycosyltransferase involved in cell wall biosynthesis
MKILIYSHDWAPSIGGVQTVTMSLARGVAEWHEDEGGAAPQVTVVTTTPADGMDDSLLPFCVVRRPGVITLARLMQNADMIHLAGPSLLPLFLGWLLRKLMVVEHHSFQAACPNGMLFYEPDQAPCPGHFMARRYGECLRCNAANVGWWKSSLFLLDTFPRRSFSKKASTNLTPTDWLVSVLRLPRMITMPHGVHEEAASGILSASSPVTFVFLGRLVPLKGVRYLLQAADRLQRLGFTFRLKIIGEGPEREGLERMVRELGLDGCVKFLGYVPPEKLEQSMADALAVVLPSLGGEVFGLAAVESMLRGRVAIVPAGGAMAEVVGDAGLQFPPADVEGLAQCLRNFLEDSALRQKLSRRGQVRSRELFEEQRMVKQHLEFYRGLLGAKARPIAKPRNSVPTHA